MMEKFEKDTFGKTYGSAASAADWAKQSRAIGDKGRGMTKGERQIKRQKQIDREAEQSAMDLANIKVAHDFDQIKDGQTILTLADSRVLDADAVDTLENIEIVKHDKNIRNAVRRGNKSAGDLYGDTDNQILAKYNEDEMPKRAGFRLGQTNLLDKQAAIKRKLTIAEEQRKQSSRTTDSVGSIAYNLQSDYMTPDEMKKLGIFKKKKNKKKKRRKKIE
eukprot:UN31545